MPIDYIKYPPNWKTEIRPRILKRANNSCEHPGCTFKNGQLISSLKREGVPVEWVPLDDIDSIYKLLKYDAAWKGGRFSVKEVKVVLTIAHLDHDPENFNVSDDRLKALCQLHHLRYDSDFKRKKH